MEINKSLKCKPTISNWGASFRYNKLETLFTDTNGSKFRQNISYILPQLIACAEHKKQIQTRTLVDMLMLDRLDITFQRVQLNKSVKTNSQ